MKADQNDVEVTCPNKDNHISAFPAYDRILCPYCHKKYVRKPIERQLTRV